jgi:hypothetical protein
MAGSSSHRGRPVGSITLTAERRMKILEFIRAGVADHVAAETAGVPGRTFREWIARGEGRSPRRSTPKLRAFAEDVRTARAQARISAEARVFREKPAIWLARAARSRPEADGWTEPVREEGRPWGPKWLEKMSDEELDRRIEEYELESARIGDLLTPPCANKRCRCPFHIPRDQREASYG